MKRYIIILICIFPCLAFQSIAQVNYAEIVNPFIGTGGHGHTFPGAVAPFGMVQVSPDTRIDGSWDGCSGYHQSDSIIYGFSHTHLSGTGCSEYGDIMIMPMMGKASFDNKIYSSKYSHKKEKANAGYYSVHLDDDDIDVELTTTTRVGFHKYTFNKAGKINIILDLLHRDKLLDGKIKIVDNKTIEGYRKSYAWAADQRVYFRIEFSKPFTGRTLRGDGSAMLTGGAFEFDVKKREQVFVKVAISGVDVEGAKKNMEAELPQWDFNKVKTDCEALWNNELNKIQVKGGTSDQQVIFYTALYHCFIHPSIYNDVDGRYLGRDMQIHKTDGFNYYTVFSLWDTFRALHPLFNIVQRERNLDFIKTFLEQYKQIGRLPMWELSSNETDCMIGNHAISVIADAHAKGIRGFDEKLAIEACDKSIHNFKKYGYPIYYQKGFLSVEDEGESVSKTLEYSYNDWCLSQLYQSTKTSPTSFQNFSGENWKNIFNPNKGFIQPRSNGDWLKPFNPKEVNNHYTEANAWQYNFFVPQDVKGLIEVYGGKANFEAKLDEMFNTSSKTDGREQADITGLIGQYAHGNEPSHHMAYLYNFIGKPEKTEQKVIQIINEMYSNMPDGLSGNEDCGQMSAWYVFSAMGFYPFCPGENKYARGKSIFDEVQILGKKFEFTTTEIVEDTKSNNSNFEISPIIDADRKIFKDSLLVSMYSLNPNKPTVYYTMTGADEQILMETPIKAFTKPFYIKNSVKIHAHSDNKIENYLNEAYFHKIPHNWTIKLNCKYNKQYTAGGEAGIIDGLFGYKDWHKGGWQGYQSQDFEAIIDMQESKEISEISSSYLQDSRSWILLPKDVEYFVSNDGINFTSVAKVGHDLDWNTEEKILKKLATELPQKVKTRYLKVLAKNYGALPKGHLGFGGDAFIFIDEIEVK
ncbi:MAG: glycoside hydrolase family 92 protein [Bacteroidetes bacterium]|nr:glycoside hydrolase family 92 protein [Bacteroidota bacterium]